MCIRDSIKTVPASRLKTAFDFTEGFQVASAGKQINYIMIDPEAQVSRVKYSYIKAVSYTHLDVYKRQNQCWSVWMAAICAIYQDIRSIGGRQ